MREERLSLIGKSRREILTGLVGHRQGHIASVLVQAWPERLAEIETAFAAAPGIESHGTAGAGKLIVTIEAESDADLIEAIGHIQATAGVITASLVYHMMDEHMMDGAPDRPGDGSGDGR